MKSEKVIIELKDLSKIYQMGEEISVKALDHINLGVFLHNIHISISKVLHVFILYWAVAE